ncbi:alpha/beta fold hydrolase [Mycobacterium sp. NPDC051804]|uniref:alpha/beta fold hydrolase n=1 Tax=Mycobacterium sp. NPDC051804 TaxID=3364295 RepID=UPI0037BBAC48
MSVEPPQIEGVRRSFVVANGVKFHVTEAGPPDGRPVLALHGWPQHHWEWRDLLADPPPGLRIIAPDLPGYGWSGPPSHRMAKEDLATDVLALLDALGLSRVLFVAHDWGAYTGYRMILREPERFDGYIPMNMAHPWQKPTSVLPHLWKLYYQAPLATAGITLMRHTNIVNFMFKVGSDLDPADARVFADSFRNPVSARAGRDTYRTFLTHELPWAARNPEERRATVPIRALFGERDAAVSLAMVSPESAKADDYTLETVDATHFVVDERPDLVRKKLIALAEETAGI